MPYRNPFSHITLVFATIALVASSTHAAFVPPKDGNLTEKQLVGYIEIMKQWLADQKAAQKALEGQSGLAGVAVVNRIEEKRQAAIKAQGMTSDEFDWVAKVTSSAWAANTRDELLSKMKDDIDKQLKANDAKLAEMKSTLATYQKAQAVGRRVMTADERKSAIDSATDDQKSALDEAKQHADDAKAAQADVDKAAADQKAAETALKNPPKFDNDDDKTAFVAEKQGAIQTAKDAAKDAQDKVAEAKKAEAESRAKAAGAADRIKNPDAPATDDDKAAVKQQNDDKIKELADNIKQTEDGNKLMQDTTGQQLKLFAGDNEKERPPAQTMTFYKKHDLEYKEAMGFLVRK